MPPSRSRYFAAAAALVAACTFLIALEVVLRLVPAALPLDVLEQFEPSLRSKVATRLGFQTRQNTELVPRDDGGPADLLWVYRPGIDVTWTVDEPGVVRTVRMDAAGFCNAPGAENGPVDLLAIGDSLTFCTAVAVDATWVAAIAPMLGMRTYNLALPGRGPYEYLQLLRAYGLARTPRVVVMTVYEGNDFRDAYVYRSAGSDGARDRGAVCPFRSGLACSAVLGLRDSAVGRRSVALNFLTGTALHLAARARKKEIVFRYQAHLADGTVLDLNSRNGDRDEVTFARALADGSIGTDIFDDALSRFVEMGRSHGFTPVLVYIPSAYTAFADVVRFEDTSIQETMRGYSDSLRRYFSDKSRELGYQYLDATPALSAAARSATRQDTMFFPANVHLTAGGHQVVAEELARFLKERGMAGGGGQPR